MNRNNKKNSSLCQSSTLNHHLFTPFKSYFTEVTGDNSVKSIELIISPANVSKAW